MLVFRFCFLLVLGPASLLQKQARFFLTASGTRDFRQLLPTRSQGRERRGQVARSLIRFAVLLLPD